MAIRQKDWEKQREESDTMTKTGKRQTGGPDRKPALESLPLPHHTPAQAGRSECGDKSSHGRRARPLHYSDSGCVLQRTPVQPRTHTWEIAVW